VQAMKQELEPASEPLLETDRIDPENLEQVMELASQKRQAILRANIINNVHLVHFEPGRIEFGLGEHGKRELPYEIAKFLSENTSRHWVVTISNEAGAPTLQQQWDAAKASQRAQASEHPLFEAVLETFPGAIIDDVRKSDLPPT
jgi:DNA polymerase-3 subunit gamma/tau